MKKITITIPFLLLGILLCQPITAKAVLACPQCAYPYAEYICRGAHYSTDKHFTHTIKGVNCTYYLFEHGNNISCPLGHLTYSDMHHTGGTERHSAGCANTSSCNGLGSTIY